MSCYNKATGQPTWTDMEKEEMLCVEKRKKENPVTDIYFSLKPGYEELASEMIAYADVHMPIKGGKIQMILFGGLAAAALSEMYRRMKALGATHMTGGDDGFYQEIGYKPAVKWTYWERQ